MTPTRFRKIRILRGFTQREMAGLLTVNSRTIQRWEAGKIPIPAWAILLLKLTKGKNNAKALKKTII